MARRATPVPLAGTSSGVDRSLIAKTCNFETARLSAVEWRTRATAGGPDIVDLVIDLLTPAVTSTLPIGWQGNYDHERARQWIAERDHDGTVLLVTERATGEPVGLVILGEVPAGPDPGAVELRLGYMLAESAWGQGFATELVGGVVNWCRTQEAVCSIAGGVEARNPASERVLAKNDFVAVTEAEETGEKIYELRIHH